MNAAPSVQCNTRHPIFDVPTTQAVVELRDALRYLDELEQEDCEQKSLAYREMRKRERTRARQRLAKARAALEGILLGDGS